MATILGLLVLIGIVIAIGLIAVGMILYYVPGRMLAQSLLRAGAVLMIGTILFGGVANAVVHP